MTQMAADHRDGICAYLRHQRLSQEAANQPSRPQSSSKPFTSKKNIYQPISSHLQHTGMISLSVAACQFLHRERPAITEHEQESNHCQTAFSSASCAWLCYPICFILPLGDICIQQGFANHFSNCFASVVVADDPFRSRPIVVNLARFDPKGVFTKVIFATTTSTYAKGCVRSLYDTASRVPKFIVLCESNIND